MPEFMTKNDNFTSPSQRKNIILEPIPKHAGFLSRYFNHEPCMNNAVLCNHDAPHQKWKHGDRKLMSIGRIYGRCDIAVCNGFGTQRYKRTFSWKSCNQATLWTWHVHHSGLAGAFLPWNYRLTPAHEFSPRSSEENEHHTIVTSIFLNFMYFLRPMVRPSLFSLYIRLKYFESRWVALGSK